MLFAGQPARLKRERILQILFHIAGIDRTGVVAGKEGVDLVRPAAQLAQAFDVPGKVPVAAEHVDRAALLHGIPGEQQPLFAVEKSHAAVGVPGDLDRLQPIGAAAEYIAFPERQQADSVLLHQMPVVLVQIARAEVMQAGFKMSAVLRIVVVWAILAIIIK